MKNKLGYVCSPYKGDVIKNIANARKYAKIVFKEGYLPICVHGYIENVTGLYEENGEREKIMEIAIQYLSKCEIMFVFQGNGISEGMRKEINYAIENGIKIRRIYEK